MNDIILVVGENKRVVEILKSYFKKENYLLLLAFDGEEALQKFRQYSPSLVLLDVMIPKINGFEVCRAIRQEANTPIIFVTAQDDDDDKIMGFTLGADDYIIEPVSPNLFIARIKAVMRRAGKCQFATINQE